MTRRPISEWAKELADERRSELHDDVLLGYYLVIKGQVERGRREDVLIEYINELEYRGLKYE